MNMKCIFIAYDQAYYMEIVETLEEMGCRGFTLWTSVAGRGSETGEPHMGSHAWPVMNHALLVMVEDGKVDEILDMLKEKDELTPELGIRAFVWNIEKSY